MHSLSDRIRTLRLALDERILVLDGAMGTMLQQRDLHAQDFGGAELRRLQRKPLPHPPGRGPRRPPRLLSRPAPTSSKPTPSAPRRSCWPNTALADRGVRAQPARRANSRARRPTSSRPPGGRASSPAPWAPPPRPSPSPAASRSTNFANRSTSQAKGLVDGGADILLVETCQDTRNVKAALLAIERLSREAGSGIPVMVSGTIEPMGTMLAGPDRRRLLRLHRPRRSALASA